jgi:hypothetical protein
MMKIVVTSTLRGHITQDRFSVRLFRNANAEREYRGEFEAGSWEFKLYHGDNIILQCQRISLPTKESFLGLKTYSILYESEELCKVKKVLFKKTVIWNGHEYAFPTLLRPRIPDMNLRFPRTSLLWRFAVRSYSDTTDPEKIMLAIVLTILVWLTWNALPAD